MSARISALLIALALALPAAARAQETTGSINGRVVDTQGLGVPGVTVTVTGPQGARSFVTDSEGNFRGPYLTPGAYSVRAELQGFKSIEQKNVNVSLGQTVDLNLKMEVGGLTETVEVTGGSPVVDTSRTTIGGTVDSEMLRNIPVGRRFSDTLYVVPGVSSSGAAGQANPSVSGGSGLENTYVVDGVNITNGGYGALGSYSIVFGSLGNGTPFDFIKESQVKTGGYEAEFGQSTGGVINVITKSGSNNYRGSLFAYARPEGLEGDWANVQSENGTVNTTGMQVSDSGAEIGGPVLRDKLFFFGAVDPQWESRTFIAPEGFPLESEFPEGVDRKRRIVNYAAKGTFQLNAGHRFDVTAFGDPAHGENGPQRTTSLLRTTTSAFSELNKYGGHTQGVRYDGIISPQWLVEASYGRALNEIEEVPSVNQWSVTNTIPEPDEITGGIGFYEAGNRSLNNQFKINSTNILGSHELRYGVGFENLTYDQVNQRTGPTFTLVTGETTATGATIQILADPNFGQIYRVTRANLNATRTTEQRYAAFYVQDTYRVTNRLTLKPGLRYEQQTLVGTLVDDFTLKNNWAPRLGAIFDFTGTGRGKLYGNWGRYYARIPNDLAARALSADAGIGADYFDANLTQPIPNGVLAGPEGRQTPTHFSIAGAGASLVDPDAKLTYLDEALGGFEYEALPGLNVGVRYVYRNLGRVLEDIAPFSLVAADLGIEGADSVDYIVTNPGSDTATAGGLGAAFEKPIHKYHAVEFTAEKRFADNWSLQSSYRWSRLRGTFEGFFRDDNGQSDPGITSLYDFPTNDPSYTQIGVPQFGYRGDIRYLGRLGEGPLPLDRTHQMKVFGNRMFGGALNGLNIGVGLTFSSGKPLTPLAANPHPNYQNGGEIPEGPRGSGFETVDGFRTRTPFQRNVDLQAAYVLRFGGIRRLTLLADVFNVFDTKTVLDYDNFTETTFGVANPDFGKPISQNVAGPQITTPRQVRLGARFEF
jgi:outer membrane receptor protein involved in Fe transport